ncbi:MAG TPA: hypothetical protein VE974_09360 [Thermoanaerobaculia bacterium]|nr:hypothetical protein [Thermoanaerobaculia bacterium]
MSATIKTDGSEITVEPATNRYSLDAQTRIALLRGITDFLDSDEEDGRPLTPAEMRLASLTTPAVLEKAAIFSDAAPTVATGIVSPSQLRDTISYELAYDGVIDELIAAARRGRLKILRRKLKVSRNVRVLYRMAKGYVTSDAGDSMRTHLEEMKRTLVRPRRKKVAAPPEEEAAIVRK